MSYKKKRSSNSFKRAVKKAVKRAVKKAMSRNRKVFSSRGGFRF